MASVARRMMVYLGLVDDDEYDEYQPYPDQGQVPAEGPGPGPLVGSRSVTSAGGAPAPEPDSASGVRTLPREPESGVTVQPRPAVVRPITPVQSTKVHVIAPGGFGDAPEIGEKLKVNQPVIVNLQGVDRELSRRLIDFAAGLTYGVGGKMERVGDGVFLLTPTNVEVSPEEKRRLQERGLYTS